MPAIAAGTEGKPEHSKGGAEGTPNLSELATIRPPKTHVKHLTLGSFPEQIYTRMEDFARQEGIDVDSCMRGLLIRALDELKPTVPEETRVLGEVKGEWRTIKYGKDSTVERFFIRVDLKESHQSLVDAWNCVLRGALDRYQINLLPLSDGRIPICFYPDNPKLPQVLRALKIDVDKLPVLKDHTLDVISSADLLAGGQPPVIRLMAPQDMLAFINRSPNFLAAVKDPIEAARRRYGASFGGVDGTCKTLNDGQITLIERLRVTCEKLVASTGKK